MHQFVFRENYSAILVLIEILYNIRDEMENSVLGIYLDLSKSFDTVDHTIFLHKLEFYGIRGHILQ